MSNNERSNEKKRSAVCPLIKLFLTLNSSLFSDMTTFSPSELESLATLLAQSEEPKDVPQQDASYSSAPNPNAGFSGTGSAQNLSVVSPGDIGLKTTKSPLADSATSRIRKKKYNKYVIWTDEEIDNEVYFEPPDDRSEPLFCIISFYIFVISLFLL